MSDQEIENLANGVDFSVSRETIIKHDDILIDNINVYVGEDDVLWHLGDFCFGPKHDILRVARNYRNRIKCKHINFIWGNHDRYEIASIFESTNSLYKLNINYQKIVLCHYAFAIWEDSHKGAFHLYGHSHATAETWLDRLMPGRRSFDVGVDNAYRLFGEYRPLSFEEVCSHLANRDGIEIDHHISRENKSGQDQNR